MSATAPRFFCPEALTAGSTYALPNAAAHHAARVLRLKIGDALIVFNGQGGEYPARIQSIERTRVLVELGEYRDPPREAPLAVTLVQALSVRERMDTTVQKAVELGVHRIVPVMSERSVMRVSGERAEKRVEHWRQIAIAACEQCGRNRIPDIEPIVDLPSWLARSAIAGTRWMLSPTSEHRLGTTAAPQTTLEILVGPEGGLSDAEERLASTHGFEGIRLGPRILRTETAAPALLAAIQARWGDF